MPEFPRIEAAILVLARTVAEGIKTNAETFPNPPVAGQTLEDKIVQHTSLRNQIVQTESLLKELINEKKKSIAEISEMTKKDVSYAQIIAKNDKTVLAKIGWRTRAARTPLQVPGQCLGFEVSLPETGVLRFQWQAPADGGKTAAYKIRRKTNGHLTDVAVALETSVEITFTPTGSLNLYHVIAINKAGEGTPSNTIQLAL